MVFSKAAMIFGQMAKYVKATAPADKTRRAPIAI